MKAWLILFRKTWEKCLLDCKGLHVRYTNMIWHHRKGKSIFCQIVYEEPLSMRKKTRDKLACHADCIVKGNGVNFQKHLERHTTGTTQSPSGNVNNESTCSRGLLAKDA